MKTQTYLSTVCIILTASLLLSGCQAFQYWRFGQNRQMSASTQNYLQQASLTQGIDQQHYRLLAANQLLTENNLNDAEQLLAQIPNANLNSEIYSHKLILKAKLALQKDQPKTALRDLYRIQNLNQLSPEVKITYYDTASSAHLRNHDLAYSTLARISLTSLLQDPSMIQANNFIIWRNLQTLSPDKLNQLLERSTSSLLRGWIQLALSTKQQANQPIPLARAIQQWKTQYSTHPADNILPNDNDLNNLYHLSTPTQIALLLPLQGKFGKMGQAIRDGFMTVFYQEANQLPKKPDIKIYDTSQDIDINMLYQLALDEGAQFVIGPLTKENVATLASKDLAVPTLALNYLPDSQSGPFNLIQLGLSPTQAAKQAAEQAWQQGIRYLITITPNDDWGNKVQQAFSNRFSQLGGAVIDGLAFTTQNNRTLANEIAEILQIDQNHDRAKQLKTVLKESFKTSPRRRQDIQGIFLAATPSKAKQIQPLLRFYYAGDLPVISIANIYTGNINPRSDRDLNGIYFNSMPWLLADTSPIAKFRKKIQSIWASNYRRYNQFYGLGIDTYHLSILMPRLRILPHIAINGVTGQLYLNNDQRIYRQLLWAQFQQGKAKLI